MPTFIRALAATLLTFSLATTPTVFAADPTAEAEWLELFNGKDLSDWTVKVTGQPLGQDKYQTFRVSNGILEVRYDQYAAFDNQFGHLFTASLLPITNCLWSTALSANNCVAALAGQGATVGSCCTLRNLPA